MSYESDFFKRYNPDFEQLTQYGFRHTENGYEYSADMMDGQFRAQIYISDDCHICGKIIETELNEEYIGYRIANQAGAFVGQVRQAYNALLNDIRQNCFTKQYFLTAQANRIAGTIIARYGDIPEFMWDKAPGFGVFRNPKSHKWYALVMNIDKSKLDGGSEAKESAPSEVEVLNLKLTADLVQTLLSQNGYYPSYHMKKPDWISLILDETIDDDQVMKLVEISHANSVGRTDKSKEWLVPANPKYYDIEDAFRQSDEILWKQSGNILVGDIAYMYVAQPVSAILYKCEVTQADIPYRYHDDNLAMTKAMRIRLLKTYSSDAFTFAKLSEYGIRAVRGPRGVPESLSRDLNR